MSDHFAIKQDLSKLLKGQVLTSIFDRGRYATDASIYQMMPIAVVIPKNNLDVAESLSFAKTHGIPILPRGGGTSQCGQTVNHAIVIDYSKHLNKIIDLNTNTNRCTVQSGIVLDELNRQLKPYGLWFPVDVSTASRATVGGMAANNSCGSRSIRYGVMRDNVQSISALLPNGEKHSFGMIDTGKIRHNHLADALLQIGINYRQVIEQRFPKVLRRVGGYNLDALIPSESSVNLSHLLVGSEGTLSCFESIELKLSRLPTNKVLGICHFPNFYAAMDSTQHLVSLNPTAVELIDHTMIDLARDISLYKPTIEKMVQGDPASLLLVEFAEEDSALNLNKLNALEEMMADLGFNFSNSPRRRGGVVQAVKPEFQSAVFDVRKAGLNIMMSMKDDRKPISFVEDCAVDLKDLAEYTSRLNGIFKKHDTWGTWYAHASVGCLHVRPVLNLRQDQDIKAMRAIAEECFEMVREYKGSHSGEHGDGICRSEFHEKMFGRKMTQAFAQVKQAFDPDNLMNPGKIVDPLKMDDARNFRFNPEYKVRKIDTVLDWKGWTGSGGGLQGASEMCNNNGACRKLSGGVMCPSYRVTRDEEHLTRGRANTLRLAISGQLGKNALTSEKMQDAMKLCIGCKACRRECPTGVDMAKMKIEVDAAYFKAHGAKFPKQLIANLPKYAPYLSRTSMFSNLFSDLKILRALTAPLTGLSSQRNLPKWHSKPFTTTKTFGSNSGKPVVLFADTFNTWFEPFNLRAAARVLVAGGYRVHIPKPTSGKRPVCCGRTYLTSGMVDLAKQELSRTLDSLKPFLQKGIPVVGLEPSCILGFRDEIPSLMRSKLADQLAGNSFLLEEFLCKESPDLPLKSLRQSVLVHGHCHQKSFNQMKYVQQVLLQVKGLDVSFIESGCCGMAGNFGYLKDTYQWSEKIAALDLIPAIRNMKDDCTVIADGTSCRHQIQLGTGHEAKHVVKILDSAIY